MSGGYDVRSIGRADYVSWFHANRELLQHRSPFHDPAWLEAVSRGIRFDLGFVGFFDRGELEAVVPGFLTKRGPFRLFGSPLRGTMTSYLGPVTLAPRTDDGMREMAAACASFARRRWHTSYVSFTLRDAPAERVPLPGPSWHEKRAGSYRLDLTPGEDALFAGLKAHCRRNVRRAARQGVTIVSNDDHHCFYRILQDTFRRHGSANWHSPRFFEIIMRDLVQRDLLWSWGALYQGDIIAVGLFFHDEREMHYISGASLSGYGSLPTSYLLHWNAIATATRAGLRVFNSEASKIQSIDAFKETFNPVRGSRSTLTWAPRPVWAAQSAFRTWHKRLRHLRSRLPGELISGSGGRA
jgi:Acetyltransferase (GNAT) domain